MPIIIGMTTLESFGRKIADARRNNRLTQSRLAELAGVSRATVDALENARTSDIGVSRLIRILDVLGLELVVRSATQQRPTMEELLQEVDND